MLYPCVGEIWEWRGQRYHDTYEIVDVSGLYMSPSVVQAKLLAHDPESKIAIGDIVPVYHWDTPDNKFWSLAFDQFDTWVAEVRREAGLTT